MEQYVKGFQRFHAGEDVRPITSCLFHVCGYTAIDKLPKGKKELEHGLAGNVVIFDQFLILHF